MSMVNKSFNRFCLAKTSKSRIFWRSIIYTVYGWTHNYEDILADLFKSGISYNYILYVKFINSLDKVTQLMIYYRLGDKNNFNREDYTQTERYIASFMLGSKKNMDKYQGDIPERGKNFFNTLLTANKAKQQDIDSTLIWAIDYNYFEIAKYMVHIGANIDSCLEIASIKGNIEIIKYLVGRGANIHHNDNWVIALASSDGRLDIIKYLVKYGADIHGNDNSAIGLASRYGHLEVVKYLVSLGADIHADNDYAIVSAVQNNHVEVVDYLLSLI